MNILFLAHKLPWPLHDGYNLHNHHYLVRLAEHHAIHLVALGESALPLEVAGLLHSVRIVAPRKPRRESSLPRRVVTALSVDQVFDFDPEVMAAAEEVLRREAIDVIWTAGDKMLVYSRRLQGAPVLGDIADEAAREAWNDLLRARQPVALLRGAKNLVNAWRFQRKYLAHVAACTVVSEVDQQLLVRNCPGLDVRVIPNGVDADWYRPRGEPERYPTLVFEGTMDFAPNVEGVLTFCRDTLPLIRSRVPQVRFLVVGKDPVREVRALQGAGVEVTGFVPDVRPWVEQASVFVCPLRRGAGIKNKILQAWALERPVVATSMSVGGLPLRPGGNALVADDPQAFANAVVALLEDETRRRHLGREGRRTVLEECTWEQRAAEMEALLEELAAGGGGRRPAARNRVVQAARG